MNVICKKIISNLTMMSRRRLDNCRKDIDINNLTTRQLCD